MSRSFSYDRYDNHRRRPASATRNNTLGYWVPLVITVTLAAGGLAAWVWSTRDDHESTDHGGVTSDDENLSYGEEARAARERYGRDPRHPASEGLSEGVVRDDEYVSGGRNGSDQTFLGGMQRGAQEVFKRTPSPQQAYDSAKKWGAAGIAAAGAAAAGALSAIREESTHSRDGRHESRRADEYFSDQERWSEEADSKRVVTHADQSRGAVSTNVTAFSDSLRGGSQQHTGGRRKIVAIVLSSEAMLDQLQDEDGKYHSEHASLLSHLPQINPNTTSLQILIYNPNPSRGAPKAPSSIGSSYAAINTPAQTPGEELQQIDPQPYSSAQNTPALSARSSGGDFFDLLYKQAVRIVEDPVNVLTFETQQGWVHMCKHMSPDLVYVVDSLSGANGQNIEAVKGWVGQVVVVVGGGGSGLGGLIDTEDEMSDVKGKERVSSRSWWMDSNMIGLGKGVEIVDGNRFSDDWERRVSGRE